MDARDHSADRSSARDGRGERHRRDGDQGLREPSANLVQGITAEAHRQGLRVWTHATIFPAKPSDAVAAGADTLSHSPYLVWEAAPKVPDDYGVRARGDFEHIRPDAPQIIALLDAMHRQGTILDATLSVFRDEAEHHPDKVGVGIMPWGVSGHPTRACARRVDRHRNRWHRPALSR